MHKNSIFRLLITFTLLLFCSQVNADLSTLDNLIKKEESTETSIFLFLTALSFIPVAVVALTAFTRIIIVLSMLRYAFGMQQTPPNLVLIVLALFFTLFVMQPTFTEINDRAIGPYVNKDISLQKAVETSSESLKLFMIKQTREKDLELMLRLSNQEKPNSVDEIGMLQIIPSFMLSELRTAFQIAFVLFIPFLMIDLIVAGSLMSLGMIMVPPMTISMPIKVLVFVLVDGWSLVSESLISSFN